jgi:hypothetical protein
MALILLVFHSKMSFNFDFEFTLWGGKKRALLICATAATGVTVGLNRGISNSINISLGMHPFKEILSHLTLNLRFTVAKRALLSY